MPAPLHTCRPLSAWACTGTKHEHWAVQEIDESEESRVPRTIEVELTGDLVGSCCAGDEVTVLGIVRVLSAESGSGQCHICCCYCC